MDRRQFVGLTSATVAGLLAEHRVSAVSASQSNASRTAASGKSLMKVGTQHGAFAFGYIKALIAAVAAET
jgi:hypothetical protein